MSTKRFQQYIDYINDTGMNRVPVEIFDDDHEPIGPMVRDDMYKAGLITINKDGIALMSHLSFSPITDRTQGYNNE